MKTIVPVVALLSLLCGTAQATSSLDAQGGEMQRTDRIRILGRIDGWRPLGNDALILWATPFKPYLVELSHRSLDLPFAQAIRVTSTAGNVYERFDSVIVDGFRYPIKAIYALDRKTARTMKAT